MLLLASYANNLIPWQGNKVATTILSLATLQMKMLKQTERKYLVQDHMASKWFELLKFVHTTTYCRYDDDGEMPTSKITCSNNNLFDSSCYQAEFESTHQTCSQAILLTLW